MACFMPPIWQRRLPPDYPRSNTPFIRRLLVLLLAVCHASVALNLDDPSPMCRHPENLNGSLFRWNAYTAACLLMIVVVAGPLRLAAVAALGSDFIGDMAPPPKLVTWGVYRYVQHPGYTGQVAVLASNLAMLFRWDGVLGCWIPGNLLKDVQGWGFVTFCLVMVALVQGLPRHVMVEELLLKNAFGRSWERWHASTWRFIPGLI
ncbi:hypothetical protein S40288_04092 [Stachybotrys chartarum IBT 40288]|nr:hypothetical protein S40288_04092 [Stachybotrys chartarum IBT 40288]